MSLAQLSQPSWKQGYARSKGVSAFPGLREDLVGAWEPQFGPTGLVLRDVAENNNAVLSGGMDATDWVVDENGYMLDYDGISEFTDLGPTTWDSSPFTLVMQFTADTPGTESRLFARGGLSGNNPSLQIISDGIRGIVGNTAAAEGSGGGQVVGGSASISAGVSYQVALTLDGVRLKLYLDGQLIQDDAAATDIGSGTATKTNIGARTDTLSEHRGTIGTTLWYRRALNAAEISHLYRDSLAPFRRKRRIPGLVIEAPTGIVTPYYYQHLLTGTY